MVEFQQNVIFPAIFLHAECSSTIPSLSKSAAAIRTCGEHPNGITINYVTVSSICNRARCVIGSRRAAVGGRARRRTQLYRTFRIYSKSCTYLKVANTPQSADAKGDVPKICQFVHPLQPVLMYSLSIHI